MQKSARGQITIVDLNDGKTLSLYLRPSQATTQIHNTDNNQYTPNWDSSTGTPMRIYPELFIGTTNVVSSSAVSNIVFTINGDTDLSKYDAGYNDQVRYLSIGGNMKEAMYRIECSLDYTDPSSLVTTRVQSVLGLVRSDTAGSSIRLVLSTPDGYVFQRNLANPSKSLDALEIDATVWRGSSKDITDIKYTWYQDGVEITEDTEGVEIFGDGGVIEVSADAVPNVSIFRCEIQDTDATSPTYGQTLQDAITLYDMTDPISLEIRSTTGTSLTTAAPSTTLNAMLFQDTEIVDDSVYLKVGFCWKMYDKNGILKKWRKIDSVSKTASWVDYVAGQEPVAYNVSQFTDAALKNLVYNNVVVTKSDIVNRATIVCEGSLEINA